jgi:protein SCO1
MSRGPRQRPGARIWPAVAVAAFISFPGDEGLAGEGGGSAVNDSADRTLPLRTAWIPVAGRRRLQNLDIALKDQDGRPRTLSTLVDKPVLMTFFYTRCQNARKCSTTVSQLATLQRRLMEAGVADKVRLLAITFEPQHDTPERIARYVTARGLKLGPHAVGVQLDGERHQRLVDELSVPVSFNAGWVSTHGVEAALLDAHGRLARKYTTLVWNNQQVVEDLQRLLREP